MPPKRILIIDDDADIRDVVALSFETAGEFEVTTAEGGKAGIISAHEKRPDLILLDVMMPEMDGTATFALLQESEATRSIPIVFLTAKMQRVDQRQLSALGAHGIIAKPFDPMQLAADVIALAGW